ncbi:MULTISPECIES: phage tail domain-containing protein [unclassified Mammaliicoccus]|uniref:phage tail domain-containing protein n=1 Tax=unclassified Mammaliicoccus TaxID=2803851 RepID=UPI001EFA91EF
MLEDRWLKLITDNGTIDVQEEIPGLLFLGVRESPPVAITNNVQLQGIDGELPGAVSYGPYELTVNIGFDGYDIEDVELAEQKLRGMFNTRGRYYIVHSQMPGKKYAVDPPAIGTPEFLDATALMFEITFVVYKGYSESLKDTSQFSLSSGEWQLEQNILARDDIKYEHDIRYFQIYNGSSDTINPLMHHKLKIDIEINAPNGFSIVNLTNGNEFQYFKPLTSNDKLTILGVHPYLNNKRVGKNTNYDFLTLEPGFNEILIKGKGISNSPKTKFTFPFIYR